MTDADAVRAALQTIFDADTGIYQGRGFQRRVGYGARPALVHIDLANAWTRPGHAFSCEGMETIIPAVQALNEAGRAKGIPVVYTYHTDMHGYSEHYHIPTPVIRAGAAFYGRHLKSGKSEQVGNVVGKYEAVEAANARIFEAAQVIIVPTATALRRHRTAAAYADRIRVVPGRASWMGATREP